MKALYKLATAATLTLANAAWGGSTQCEVNADVAIANVGAGANADSTVVFASAFRQIDRYETPVSASADSQFYVSARSFSELPPKQADAVTVVPLPPAAPAGLLTLGLIGLVGFIRQMRKRGAQVA